MLSKVRINANQNGVALLNQEINEESVKVPPRNGPMMKPKPKATPIMPKFFVFCVPELISAIADITTEILPPVRPSMMRPMINNASEW
ncbi:MAG: hypothetical protein A2912_03700 [Candidatus Buchananbacteria bacterium RIFCSPLOWO2_01_FULL_40_23b]|uniref:Uncharacterized protein n=1 Tax=Candidatus Buchananbacteria bacterium RIFCSPLOWO2_01_FULL_40_23b TaxID=1797544 RepID=A0A1G1YMM3_9BACT|nr:MAG: hypothetical protein A2912_03700 [Candidatus Buchananbacteria bacterium RIFCSPLOWO2_01_FULL_40_23b]